MACKGQAATVPELMPLLASERPLQQGLLAAASCCLSHYEQWAWDRTNALVGQDSIWWLVSTPELQPELVAQAGMPSGQRLLRQLVECAARLAPAWQLSADEMESMLLTNLATAGLALMKAHITAAAAQNSGDHRSDIFPYALLPDSVVRLHLELLRLLAGMLRCLVQQRSAEIAAIGPQPSQNCQRTETDWLAGEGMKLCVNFAELSHFGCHVVEPLQQVRQRLCLLCVCSSAGISVPA
jgi:hypothetical protein